MNILKGAKGLIVNITGGEDLTLFEVEKSVSKIREEIDPEVELLLVPSKMKTWMGK